MAYKHIDNLYIENARIKFKNFSGKLDQYNREGKHTFCAIIDDPEMAQKLAEDGWNVRIRGGNEEGDIPEHYMRVEVSYKNIPPKVVMVTNRKKTELNEETIGTLDCCDVVCADLVISPYPWNVNGKSGIKAYLKKGFFNIEEDRFEAKYAEEEYPGEMPW